ncbi:hypothetical protein AB0H73_39790 [Streptomyces olivoreticuli]
MFIPDIVYIVREGDDNEELRYSLRSICANLRHEKVWMVGYRPSWVANSVEFVRAPSPEGKWEGASARMRAACESPRIPENFLYFNDDFFVMRPVSEVPVLNLGSLHTHIEHLRGSQKYKDSLMETYRFLRKRKQPRELSPISYELHVPLPVRKEGMLKAIEEAREVRRPQCRSLYGNIHKIAGILAGDCKVVSRARGAPYGPFVSTTDSSFNNGLIGKQLRAKFPDPCRYET